ncbi:MAG: hypothetical protein AAGA30_02535, partial [Planctomycetota bacterium]
KWHRICIASAGMFFEMILAATATYIWFYTHPSWLHFFCMNLIIISSISTILFNANPLLRYDGYYILSDLLEIPNMAQRAKTALLSKLRQWTLGLPEISGQYMPNQYRALFMIYGCAAFFYRWFILGVIYWFLISFFETNELSVVGYCLVAMSLTWTIAQPGWKLLKFMRVPGRSRQFKLQNALFSGIVLSALIIFATIIPIEKSVTSSAVVLPAKATNIYVSSPGTLVEVSVKPGETIEVGETILQLRNIGLQQELTELKSRIAILEAEIETYKSSQTKNSSSAITFSSKASELQKLRLQLVERQDQFSKLIVRARANGHVQPIFQLGAPGSKESIDIFDEKIIGAYLDSETAVCSIAETDDFQVIAFFDQSDVKLLKTDLQVEILFDEYPDSRCFGNVRSIASEKTSSLPLGLVRQFGGEIATKLSKESAVPVTPLFRVEIALQANNLELLTGLRAQAKVVLEKTTLFNRVYKSIVRQIRFR